jgi:hypothetical protein
MMKQMSPNLESYATVTPEGVARTIENRYTDAMQTKLVNWYHCPSRMSE